MIRRFAVRTVLGAGAAPVLNGAATTPPLVLTSMDTPMTAGGQVSVSAAAAPKKCAANFTTATIGGQQKCLAAGQQCQQTHAADYKKYGFTCSKVGNRYELSKNGAAGKPGSKPKPH
jgi:hypothetical protein